MIYPDVSTEEWCERYKIEVITRPCAHCGKYIDTTRPFATGNWRGLKATEHGCGARYLLSTAIDVRPGERHEWVKLAHKTRL